MLGWCGGTVYFLYTFANNLDGSLHYAPTNCTILQLSYDSDDNLKIRVNYTVPGNDFNYTSYMVNLDYNKSYQWNSTIPCFYSLHDPTLIMASTGINSGTIIGLVVAILLCIPVAVVALFLICAPVVLLGNLIHKWAKSTKAPAGNVVSNTASSSNSQPDDNQDSRNTYTQPQLSIWTVFHYYAMKPVVYCKAASKSTTSWLQARLTWTRSSKKQAQDMYDLEDQGSCTTRASSGYSFKSTKKLLSHSKSQRSDMTDQTSVETQSL
ncbi:unnamed protein product [Umbelopsis ramanniana]